MVNFSGDAEFGFALGNEQRSFGAWHKNSFRLQLVGDAETVHDLCEINAAGAALCRVRIDDRFGSEQRAL